MWLELLPALATLAAAVAVVVVARNGTKRRAWLQRSLGADSRDGVVAVVDRRVALSVIDGPPPGGQLVVEVDARVPPAELSERRHNALANERRLRELVSPLVVESTGQRLRVVVAVRKGVDARAVAERVCEYALGLERADVAIDGEGGPGGSPVAVRATGSG